MQLKTTIEVWRKGEWYVASCPELDFVAQGCSAEEARRNLLEVFEIQFEEMRNLGTLDDYLLECGYLKQDDIFVPQSKMVSFEKSAVQVG